MAAWYKGNVGKGVTTALVGLGAVQGMQANDEAKAKLKSLTDYYDSLDDTLKAQYGESIKKTADALQERIAQSGGLDTISKYNEMIGGYDPSKFATATTDFEYGKKIEDFNDPAMQYRMDAAKKATEQSLAGQGNLFSGGAGRQLAEEAQTMASEEYGKSYERMTQDKATAYQMYRDKIADVQNQLKQQESGYLTKLGLYGGQKQDIYGAQDTARLAEQRALETLQQNQLTTGSERAQVEASKKELGSGFWGDVEAGVGGWQGEAKTGANIYGSLYGMKK